jgi:hypothetical protein
LRGCQFNIVSIDKEFFLRKSVWNILKMESSVSLSATT